MSPSRERRLLQLVILIAAVVPVTAGFWGAMVGMQAQKHRPIPIRMPER